MVRDGFEGNYLATLQSWAEHHHVLALVLVLLVVPVVDHLVAVSQLGAPVLPGQVARMLLILKHDGRQEGLDAPHHAPHADLAGGALVLAVLPPFVQAGGADEVAVGAHGDRTCPWHLHTYRALHLLLHLIYNLLVLIQFMMKHLFLLLQLVLMILLLSLQLLEILLLFIEPLLELVLLLLKLLLKDLLLLFKLILEHLLQNIELFLEPLLEQLFLVLKFLVNLFFSTPASRSPPGKTAHPTPSPLPLSNSTGIPDI